MRVDPDALIEDISVGMQQRVEILKMLYRDNEILILDEPTAVLTPQEIDELMDIMRSFAAEGKSILFITHKLNEIMAVADRCTVLRKGRCVGTVDIASTTKEELSRMMVGRDVEFKVEKAPAKPGETVLRVEGVTVPSRIHKNNAVSDVSFEVRAGEIVCLAGIEGNGQTEFVSALTGLEKVSGGKITLNGRDISHASIRERSVDGMSHIPRTGTSMGWCWTTRWRKIWYSSATGSRSSRTTASSAATRCAPTPNGSLSSTTYALPRGRRPSPAACPAATSKRPSSARELDKQSNLLVAVQPTRGLDVGAIEYIHKQIVRERDEGKAVLLVSLELDEVMNLSDRILVMYEGRVVGEFDPAATTVQELGLYMAGAKRQDGRATK